MVYELSSSLPGQATAPDVVVRHFYRAVETRNLSRLGSLLIDEVTWVNPVSGLSALDGRKDPTTLVGRTAILERLASLIDHSGGVFDLRLQSLFLDPDNVVVAFQEASLPGVPLQTSCLVFTFRANRISALATLIPVPNS